VNIPSPKGADGAGRIGATRAVRRSSSRRHGLPQPDACGLQIREGPRGTSGAIASTASS